MAEQRRRPKPNMEWPNYYPDYPPKNPDPVPQPQPKPEQRQPPPQNPRRDPFARDDKRRQGSGGVNAYDDPRDRERTIRGAYQAGINGDNAQFPAGSPQERAYQQGMRDRKRREQSQRGGRLGLGFTRS